jgi:hypothetical protein
MIIKDSKILLLSHAHSDLLTLTRIKDSLPCDFHSLIGVDLQDRENDPTVFETLGTHLQTARIVVMRVLADSGIVPALYEIADLCKRAQSLLIVLSGRNCEWCIFLMLQLDRPLPFSEAHRIGGNKKFLSVVVYI